jgi:hypothetical protein
MVRSDNDSETCDICLDSPLTLMSDVPCFVVGVLEVLSTTCFKIRWIKKKMDSYRNKRFTRECQEGGAPPHEWIAKIAITRSVWFNILLDRVLQIRTEWMFADFFELYCYCYSPPSVFSCLPCTRFNSTEPLLPSSFSYPESWMPMVLNLRGLSWIVPLLSCSFACTFTSCSWFDLCLYLMPFIIHFQHYVLFLGAPGGSYEQL